MRGHAGEQVRAQKAATKAVKPPVPMTKAQEKHATAMAQPAPEPADLASIDGPYDHDVLDFRTHPWTVVDDWHQDLGASGEHRSLRCDECGATITEGRAADPANPAPARLDPFTPPEPPA